MKWFVFRGPHKGDKVCWRVDFRSSGPLFCRRRLSKTYANNDKTLLFRWQKCRVYPSIFLLSTWFMPLILLDKQLLSHGVCHSIWIRFSTTSLWCSSASTSHTKATNKVNVYVQETNIYIYVSVWYIHSAYLLLYLQKKNKLKTARLLST